MGTALEGGEGGELSRMWGRGGGERRWSKTRRTGKGPKVVFYSRFGSQESLIISTLKSQNYVL